MHQRSTSPRRVRSLVPWALAAVAAPVFAGGSERPFEISGRAYDRAEAQANTFTASAQEQATLARDGAGRTLVVWQSRRQEDGNYGLYAQRFGADGARLGSETHLNQFTRGAQTRPCVALDASGAAWIAWESDGQDGSFGTIVARRFDAELATATNEVIVNDDFVGHQSDVALACDSAGNAVIAWAGPNADRTRSVFVRRFGADGAPLGPSLRVDAAEESVDALPSIALDPRGGFTVAWGRSRMDGRPTAVLARSFDAAGAPAGAAFRVSVDDGRMPIEPVAAINAAGELVVAWMNSFGDGDHVPTVRRFARVDAAWTPGEVREYATGTGGYTSGLDLSLAADSRFALVWASVQGEDKKGDLWARIVEADGSAGEPFRASVETRGRQKIRAGGSTRRVVFEDDGALTTAWHGDAGFGDDFGACVSFFAPAERALVASVELPPSPRFVADEQGAAPSHEPPIYDPNGAKTIQDLMDLESTAGPDYGFTGVVQTSLTPPDPHGAIGPNHYVQVVNDTIAFYTKDGVQTFAQTFQGSSGSDFFQSVGSNGFSFDPEALYDTLSGRFMVMCCERGSPSGSFFCFAVSDDSDPNGNWHKYRFNVTAAAGGSSSIDSPNMGVDANVVYLSADFPPFSGGSFLMYFVDKAAVLSGAVPTTNSLFFPSNQSYGQPPVTLNNVSPAYYFLENLEAASNTQVRIHAIRNPLTAPTDTVFSLTVPVYSPPEDPPQMGTTVRPEAFESRFWSTAYNNGRLWGAQHCNNPVRARWYEIDVGNWPVSGTPTLVQSGDIIPAANVRTSFVSIGVDGQNNAACVYARSASNEFFSMSRSFRLNGDAAGAMTPSVTMKTSTGPDTSGRWGDYSGCTPDPVKSKVWWGTHEYRAGIWSTWIGVFGPCDTPTTYCTAKVNSASLTPVMGWQNEPSLGTNNFNLTMSNGLAGKSVIVFWGDGQQAVPFFGGTLCVTLPIKRSAVANFDGSGFVAINRPIDVDELGVDQYAQFWYRDPAHPDGTGVGLSDAVAFRPCP